MHKLGVIVLVLALAGCTSTPPTSAPSPSSSTPAVPIGITSLKTHFPSTFNESTAKTETLRVANAIEALIDTQAVLHVDTHEQLVAATSDAAAYFGSIRTISLDASADPIAQASLIATLLETAGWIERQKTNGTGTYLIALSSNANAARSWFVVLGGDSTVKGQPVVTVQLASPDLPK